MQVKIAVVTALVLLALFALFPHLQTGFTTKDDTELAVEAAQSGSWLDTAYDIAVSQGRFYQALSMPIAFALFHLYVLSPACYYLIYLGSILLNIAVFYYLVRFLFVSKLAGLLASVLGIVYLQNNWHHGLLTSYPAVPHFALTNLFCVFIFLFAWQRQGRALFAVLAGVAFFISILLYDGFVAYFPIFLALCLYHAWFTPGASLRKSVWITSQGISAIAFGLTVYLFCYFLFRHFHPSHYEGSQLGSFSFARAAAVVWQYTSSTFPGYFYFCDPGPINVTFDGFTVHAVGLWQLLERCRIEWLAKAVVASIFCGLILLQRARVLALRSFVLALLGGFACLVAPVSLLSLTAKYQDWVLNHHSLAYSAPSYYAYFAMVFLIAVVVLYANQLLACWRIVSLAYVVFVSSSIAAASLTTDYYNYYVALDQQLSHLKWRVVDRLIQTDDFKALRDDSIIYAPSLWRYRGIVANSETYWSDYFTQKSGKKILVVQTGSQFDGLMAAGSGKEAYFLAFEQEPKESDQFVVFSRLGGDKQLPGGVVSSSEFALFTYSKNRTFTLVGECLTDDHPVKIDINGRAVEEIEGKVFFAQVDQGFAPGDFPKAVVRSTAPVDIAHLIVSYFPVEPDRKGVVYGRGFHGLEENAATGSVWNWSLARSELSLVNYTDRAVEKTIRFTLIVLTPRRVSIEINGLHQTILFEAGGDKSVELGRVVLQPGENKFYLTSDQPARPPGNGDTRPIAFGVQNLVVTDPGK